ncbi:uncharacterized protein LOC120421434 [Culex pipiens pallens]|uniref:uncharacterized protein LOC120421434 n=1 Tax=Culex pipiens pallens TaxID=42434 RepID=UPI001952CFDA|nr:uncharacterized protein LOC120421434 [Culex pipiens pallens]
MELFRKVPAVVRASKVQVLNRVRWLWEDLPDGYDSFWFLDIYLAVAAVRFVPKNVRQQAGWYLYQTMALYQMIIGLLDMIYALQNLTDVLAAIWYTMSFFAILLCLVKHYIVLRHYEAIHELRIFLNQQSFCSGDPAFDGKIRKRSYTVCQLLIMTVLCVIVLQQISIWIPTSQRDRTFSIPPWMSSYCGVFFSFILQILYFGTFTVIWVSKLFSCTVVASILIIRVKTEQEILAKNFELMMQTCLEENFFGSYQNSNRARKQFWDHTKNHLKTVLDQQHELLKHLEQLKSLVEPLFFFIYYASLIIVGTVFVVILREPLSFMTMVILSSTTISALECYCLCYLLDSFKDVNETITDHMFCFCSQLPHSGDHHADYVDVRATLMVVGYFCRHGMSFQCAGIGDISSAVFADLVNISYSVLTFLLNML